MIKFIQKNREVNIAIIFFILYSLWWIWIQTLPDKTTNPIIHFFAGSYGLIAILGAFWGYRLAYDWGGWKSIIGRSMIMFALGLIFQEFGQLAYAYYIVILKIEIPYPSIGDIGYFGSIFLYLYGIYLIAKASGIKFSLNQIENKFQAILIPLALLGYTYFLFLRDYQFNLNTPITTLLDFGYPLGQAFYIAIALLTFLLTRNILGGIMRSKIVLLLFALLLQYLADFNFLFQSSRETWVTAGYGDYLYLIAYLIMTFSLIAFKDAYNQIRK